MTCLRRGPLEKGPQQRPADHQPAFRFFKKDAKESDRHDAWW